MKGFIVGAILPGELNLCKMVSMFKYILVLYLLILIIILFDLSIRKPIMTGIFYLGRGRRELTRVEREKSPIIFWMLIILSALGLIVMIGFTGVIFWALKNTA